VKRIAPWDLLNNSSKGLYLPPSIHRQGSVRLFDHEHGPVFFPSFTGTTKFFPSGLHGNAVLVLLPKNFDPGIDFEDHPTKYTAALGMAEWGTKETFATGAFHPNFHEYFRRSCAKHIKF
jgi:hypothetical protein